MLNAQSPLPLYHQLTEILTEQIRSGIYKAGEALPAETALASHYHIGRPTVRQAMDTLVRKGLVERKRGSGTFVKNQAPPIDLFSLAGTSQAFLTRGIKTLSKMIHPLTLLEIRDDKTNPFDGEKAFFLSRLTLVDKDPVLLENIYLHSQLFLGLDKVDLENRSLSQVILEYYFLTPETGQQTFKISYLPEPEAAILGLGCKDPILEVERTLNFPKAKEAIFSRLYCRTDRFTFSQTINQVLSQCV